MEFLSYNQVTECVTLAYRDGLGKNRRDRITLTAIKELLNTQDVDLSEALTRVKGYIADKGGLTWLKSEMNKHSHQLLDGEVSMLNEK